VNEAREALAALIGVDSSTLVFTSGGTEANNMVLLSAAQSRTSAPRIVTTPVEHSSILKMCDHLEGSGAEVVLLPVTRLGHIDLGELRASLTANTALVSVQWVNNETGVVQPVEDIGKICRSAGVRFHTDAAQAIGKLDVSTSRLPVDFLSVTAHKFHGPCGVGAVFARSVGALRPLLYGGPQEQDRRAGTENLPGIVGMGKAARLRRERFQEIQSKLGDLRDQFETLVFDLVPGVEINGDPRHRVSNTTNLRFHDVDGQALVAQLDGRGIRCSQSSACTNQRPEPSYVLRAMGLSEEAAYSSVRFSFSVENTSDEAQIAAEAIAEICRSLRSFSARKREARAKAART